ncbi:MAG TPA: DoxX family protein [Thermoanaerobaculia bacterium]|nr:DoxX family protein [Thermoanaerobaculia bacterium]
MNAQLSWISRLLLAGIFILSGFNKISGFAGMTQFLGGKLGWPAPGLWLTLAILFELPGGLALLLGFRTRLASLALIVFTLAATIFVHGAFLSAAADAAAKQDQMVHILKNIAIIGGLLKYYLDGAGRFAIDREPAGA